MPAKTDRVLADRYALRETIGSGAMGSVWMAEDRVLGRRVAIKEIEPPPALAPEDVAVLETRVLREARAAAKLSHPGVVTVFDVLEEDGRPWIVMELIEAPSLAEVVEHDGPVTSSRAAAIGLELLDILEAAHAAGIVHRDVKPANVICPPEAPVMLADFGIATVQGDPKITATGLILGSPAFMAPEQAETGSSGPEADLWSLGATLYFAVEGRPPFDKGQAIPTLTAVVGEDPPPPTRAGPLASVLLELLSKDPSARPPIADTRQRLEQIAGLAAPAGAATTARQHPGVDTTRVETPPEPIPAAAEPRPRVARAADADTADARRWGLAIAAVVALLLALFLLPPLFEADDTSRGRGSGRVGGGAADDSGEGGGNEGSSEDRTVPEGSTLYEHPAGWSIPMPPGWTDAGNRAGDPDGTSVDLEDTASGSYLRVDWTTEPGDDVMASLEQQENEFAATHDDYSLLQMTPTEYRTYEAGLWEYTYVDGVPLHAYNFQFVAGEYGFALNFQTHEDDWDASQDIWEDFQATFEPPS